MEVKDIYVCYFLFRARNLNSVVQENISEKRWLGRTPKLVPLHLLKGLSTSCTACVFPNWNPGRSCTTDLFWGTGKSILSTPSFFGVQEKPILSTPSFSGVQENPILSTPSFLWVQEKSILSTPSFSWAPQKLRIPSACRDPFWCRNHSFRNVL